MKAGGCTAGRAPAAWSRATASIFSGPGAGGSAARRLAFAGVIGPVAAVVIFTVAGTLRPGYSYAFLMPRSPLYPIRIGGLLERADVIWHYAWYVAFGYRLSQTRYDARTRTAPDTLNAA